MRRRSVLLVLLALAAVPVARAQSPERPASGAGALRPGDIVRLEIWREPTLSGKFQVDQTGTVVLPKIGAVEVAGVAPRALEEQIIRSFRRYLRNPSITVTFLRRVNVLGAVRAPGLYPVDPTMTIADVLALAGGTLPYGDPDEVRLLRDGQVLQTDITQRTRVDELPIRSGDQLYVPERSWFSRNTGIVATAISSTVSLVIAILYLTQSPS